MKGLLLSLTNKKMTELELNNKRLEIAKTLKSRREELKLTQKDLAEKVGLRRETINQMEIGKFWLGMKQYVLICEALNIDTSIKKIN
jgi:DNA-binding XRE family transcriptional regulator